MGPKQQSSFFPFFPYTMFQNPVPKPSCHKSWKTLITQKVLVTQSSNIVHCDQHTQKPFQTLFPFQIDGVFFSYFVRESSVNSQKFHISLILSGKNALEWLELCIFRVWGMPNPIAQVSSLHDKWFLKNQNFRQKFHILLILSGKKCIEMAWVAHI